VVGILLVVKQQSKKKSGAFVQEFQPRDGISLATLMFPGYQLEHRWRYVLGISESLERMHIQ
jgi:hypothetical protein